MKKYILFTALFFSAMLFKAQSEDKEIDLKELQINTAPSAVLLGISPSELETPKSKKALVLSIINSFKENEGIPGSYAFEVTPFWLFTHKDMTALKYAGITEDEKQNIFNEARRFSVSLGFARDLGISSDDDVKNPAFAFSVRSTLIKIRTKKNKEDIITQNAKVVKALDNMLGGFLNDKEIQKERFRLAEKCLKENNNDDGTCDRIVEEKLNDFIRENKDKYKDYKDNNVDYYRNIMEAPPLLALDVAGGYSTFFSDNTFSNNNFGKLGFWMTLNTGFDFTTEENPDVEKKLNFYAIARYMEDGTTLDENQQFTRTRNFDVGGKAEFIYNRFSISGEWIYRNNTTENTFRASGLLAYKVSDKVYVNASFGKNYGDKDNLITFLGLNWGLDSKRQSVFVEDKK
jgi:hypothetical protein